ncbi:carbohydrate kinase family protein [Ferviditalea candida]|uniref:Carbohydrate kinase family protein n=1 Tax=Ferviditalea candida TaxID=3108399 RepID=A0ABU5ZPA7_9BACL|nr:carbohydrate kinase family protein [Paenibacillaceae bacterium T2]
MINLIGNLNAELILAQVKDRPDFGQEHLVDHLMFRPGGIANMVYPLSRLGVKPRVIATLGKDQYGKQIYDDMKPLIEDGIMFTDRSTALSVGIVNQTGSRYFVTYSGDLYDFTKETVKRVKHFEQAKLSFYYGYFLLPNFTSEDALDCLKKSKELGQITMFDANSDINGWQPETRREIIDLLPNIDYFMPNNEELLHLTGESEIDKAAEILLTHGARNIVVKQGENGAALYSLNSKIHHTGFPTKAFDTTGAGDSFNAGFAYSLLQGADHREALAFGNALASIVVSRKEERFPTVDEINVKLKAGSGMEA